MQNMPDEFDSNSTQGSSDLCPEPEPAVETLDKPAPAFPENTLTKTQKPEFPANELLRDGDQPK